MHGTTSLLITHEHSKKIRLSTTYEYKELS